MFNGLSIEDYRRLAKLFTIKTFQKGDELIKQGAIGSTFFIITHGIVSVKRYDNYNNYTIELNQLVNSDFFGEISLLTSKPCSASVISEATTETLQLSKDDFDRLLFENNYIKDIIENKNQI